MTFLLTLLAAIFVLGPLIALHEWGHYIVARLCGVRVLTYSIGFGPKLFGWTSKKSGIDYRISALPLGGYVKMLDEREGEVAKDEQHLAFNRQHPLKKIAIVAAGPIMNFVIAIALFWVLFMTPSEQLATKIGQVLPDTPAAIAQLPAGDKIVAIDGHDVQTWEGINYRLAGRMGETANISVTLQSEANNNATKTYQAPVKEFMQGAAQGKDALSSFGMIPWQPNIAPIVGDVTPDGAASRQGLKAGDRITAINDEAINDWISATRIIRDNPETLLTFSVLRNDKPIELQIMPQGKKDNLGNDYGQIGAMVAQSEIVIPDAYKTTVVYGPAESLIKSFEKTEQLAVMTVSSMGKMLSGMIGLDNLSGPITIAKVAKQSFDISWQMVLSTAALISLSLAVLNLLPIPVLDGGHIVYYLIELIRGKPLSEGVQMVGLNIGLLLLAGFMVLAIGNDISRLF
ncbi:RIP metalloprotease RseP [Psychrobacter cryohalolentis]|uniref:Zinc metalloprotease n=1 Tax=Psychrobacter cryohalolentis (strain ATCC BAA-1226 / DSM 17306 / VKM B-2378 / K5) TaxID=335284 RepID=Q1QA17_PSYCK|nr:RIP metalloprotease RseP [Psychrobacter cryohalolentis]ABE75486.1 site-2 protease, Metallo peptidase, MEROPS family M50B [Psychrobacter cryohalolentis K5]ASE25677.1 RIP metalloprotease RseP [Psychrobacter cryohalolentis]